MTHWTTEESPLVGLLRLLEPGNSLFLTMPREASRSRSAGFAKNAFATIQS
jgi:hypothetical protein